MVVEALDVSNHYPEVTWLSHVPPPGEASAGERASKLSLFNNAHVHISDDNTTACIVTLKPHHTAVRIAQAAQLFNLPDLHGAFDDYFSLQLTYMDRNGQRWSKVSFTLPFTYSYLAQLPDATAFNTRPSYHSPFMHSTGTPSI